MNIDQLVARGALPDPIIRFGIRRLLRQRLSEEASPSQGEEERKRLRFIEQLRASPVAVEVEAANTQHYEVPTEFFREILGPQMKYSSGYWSKGVRDLGEAEKAMLALTCERARLASGQDVLELGCGWGSLSLWMGEHYPESRITGVSNSRTQKVFIDSEIARRGINNLEIITADMRSFEAGGKFDRIVSVEMFEHMRNYQELLRRVASWMKPDGLLFVHIFTHRSLSYLFEPRDESDWMSRYFFSGGMMPADDLLESFQDDVQLVDHWRVSGEHYQKTAESWLLNMDAREKTIRPILRETYGAEEKRWWNYWRVFFMACAELWGFRRGEEWLVSHYLFARRAS